MADGALDDSSSAVEIVEARSTVVEMAVASTAELALTWAAIHCSSERSHRQ
eukprot:CAMPEP_0181247772 /NCGR_PEP_ID=MMETSP1096-20121128/44798_1 /TAXON_ID=156174 ORGANISM="Chrysochromulina ericina, Strain CCMP281" /NCGR_SAMPLE_ID=MMETSP1096 /ASSEMBLY_ACC=CAM_ASM_000453 /LENGTH=50 /DNA_ID=CAMNT_0023344863 /DNA_START=37 /DNA_END=186 /DNA_ORIENTATION=-